MLAGVILVWAPHAAQAAGDKDAAVLAKAVKFAQGDYGKTVALLYTPGAGQAKAEAMAAALRVLGYTPNLLNTGAGTGAAKIIYYAGNLGGAEKTLYQAARARGALTIGSNDQCIVQKTCVMSIVTRPKTEIKVNRAAADESQVKFGAAFKMIVKEY